MPHPQLKHPACILCTTSQLSFEWPIFCPWACIHGWCLQLVPISHWWINQWVFCWEMMGFLSSNLLMSISCTRSLFLGVGMCTNLLWMGSASSGHHVLDLCAWCTSNLIFENGDLLSGTRLPNVWTFPHIHVHHSINPSNQSRVQCDIEHEYDWMCHIKKPQQNIFASIELMIDTFWHHSTKHSSLSLGWLPLSNKNWKTTGFSPNNFF